MSLCMWGKSWWNSRKWLSVAGFSVGQLLTRPKGVRRCWIAHSSPLGTHRNWVPVVTPSRLR